MREAVIVSAVRTACGKALKAPSATRPDDLGAVAIQGASPASPISTRKKSKTSSSAAPCPRPNKV